MLRYLCFAVAFLATPKLAPTVQAQLLMGSPTTEHLNQQSLDRAREGVNAQGTGTTSPTGSQAGGPGRGAAAAPANTMSGAGASQGTICCGAEPSGAGVTGSSSATDGTHGAGCCGPDR